MSIQSVKAIEVGDGIASSKNYGTSVQDQYVLNEKEIKTMVSFCKKQRRKTLVC